MFKSAFYATLVLAKCLQQTAVDPASRFHEFQTLFPTSKLCNTLILVNAEETI